MTHNARLTKDHRGPEGLEIPRHLLDSGRLRAWKRSVLPTWSCLLLEAENIDDQIVDIRRKDQQIRHCDVA